MASLGCTRHVAVLRLPAGTQPYGGVLVPRELPPATGGGVGYVYVAPGGVFYTVREVPRAPGFAGMNAPRVFFVCGFAGPSAAADCGCTR